MWEKILAYLTFTRKERLGVLVLLVIILLLFVLPYFIRPDRGSPDPEAYQEYQEGIRKFQSTNRSSQVDKKKIPQAYAGPQNQDENYAADPGRPAAAANLSSGETENERVLFYFDPNRISGNDWRRLGLSDKLILTISHYIQKGGSFRVPTDLKKLYGLKTDDYERLLPFVRIRRSDTEYVSGQFRHPERNASADPQPGKKTHSGYARSGVNWGKEDKPPPEYHKTFGKRSFPENLPGRNTDSGEYQGERATSLKYPVYAYAKKMEDLDINRADSTVWSRLPGIGIRLACRIVHFREKLGGFYSVDQVRETFGLPDSTFQQIRPFLHTGETEMQKISLNEARQEALQSHPYIRWKLAKEIIQYRDQHGGFKSVAELQQLGQMDPEKFKKLEPYLEVK